MLLTRVTVIEMLCFRYSADYFTHFQLCAWLLEHENSFKPRMLDGDEDVGTRKETIRAYVQSEVLSYLRVPASTGNSALTLTL